MKYKFDIIEKKIIVKPEIKGINESMEFQFLIDQH